MVTLRTTYPDGTEWVGQGIHPDYEVHMTLQDILDDRDAILLKGIEVVNLTKRVINYIRPVSGQCRPCAFMR